VGRADPYVDVAVDKVDITFVEQPEGVGVPALGELDEGDDAFQVGRRADCRLIRRARPPSCGVPRGGAVSDRKRDPQAVQERPGSLPETVIGPQMTGPGVTGVSAGARTTGRQSGGMTKRRRRTGATDAFTPPDTDLPVKTDPPGADSPPEYAGSFPAGDQIVSDT
jgi:hypothetical protein